MSEALRRHLARFVSVSEAEFAAILAYFRPLVLRKKENLLQDGSVCTANYFVEKGCLRLFFITEKGTEQTTQFALENWWLSDYTSFESRRPSGFCIQAVEAAEVQALSADAQEALLQAHPVMERYFRLVHQRAHAAAQFRTRVLFEHSREALYHQFADRYPDFVQRVPQYLLASFLGFTPEYLSEIRRRSAGR